MSKLPALSMATPKQSTHTHTQRTVDKRGACYLSITVTSRRIEPPDYSFRLPSHSSPVSTKQPCTHFSHVPESQSMAAALFWGRPFSNRRGAATVERPQPLSLSRCMLLFFVVSKKRESLPSAIFFSFFVSKFTPWEISRLSLSLFLSVSRFVQFLFSLPVFSVRFLPQ